MAKDCNEAMSVSSLQIDEMVNTMESLRLGQRGIEQTMARQEAILEQIVKTQEKQADNAQRIALLEQRATFDTTEVKNLAQENKVAIEEVHKKIAADAKERKDDLKWIYGILIGLVAAAFWQILPHLHYGK